MKQTKLICLIFVLSACSTLSGKTKTVPDQNVAQTKEFRSPQSSCVVRNLNLKYSDIHIDKIDAHQKQSEVFDLKADAVNDVVFSPSGKYIAFGNSEHGQFTMGDEKPFQIFVYNCETGGSKVFRRSRMLPSRGEEPSYTWVSDLQWNQDEKSLRGIETYRWDKTRSFKLSFHQNKLP